MFKGGSIHDKCMEFWNFGGQIVWMKITMNYWIGQ